MKTFKKKSGSNFQIFNTEGVNLKKTLILSPKQGIYTQFLVKNCMILK